MAEFIVLYHDPLRLTLEQRRLYIAGQSVWVCRDDRYAFEVHVFARRVDPAWDFTPASCGEARYRLALALAAARAAHDAAVAEPRRRDLLEMECASEDVAHFALDPATGRTVNFGDVIARFTVATTDDGALLRRAG